MTVVRNSRRNIPRDPPQPYTPEYISLGLAPALMEPKEEHQMRQDFQRSRQQRPFAHVGVNNNWLNAEEQIAEQQISSPILVDEIKIPVQSQTYSPQKNSVERQKNRTTTKNLNTYVLVICGKMIISSDNIEDVKEKIRESIFSTLSGSKVPDIDDVCVYKRLSVSFDVLVNE